VDCSLVDRSGQQLANYPNREILYKKTGMEAAPMAYSQSSQLTSYDRLTMRVSRLVNNARGVLDRHVHVERLEASSEDWALLLEAFEETEGLIVAHRDDGSIDLFWKVCYDDF